MQAPRLAEARPRALAPCPSGPCAPSVAGPAGTIAGYAAVFGQVDAQSDVIAPGAFARSLARHARAGTWPAMLWQHEAREPIGRWGQIFEDRIGLRAIGQLVLDTRRGREAAALMRAGALTGLSIGYVAVESHRDRARGVRVLTEIDLIEISPVTFPAQPLARIAVARRRTGNADVWSAFHAARAAMALPERRFITPAPSSLCHSSDHWRTQPRVPRGNPEGGQWADSGSTAGPAGGMRNVAVVITADDLRHSPFEASALPLVTAIRLLAEGAKLAMRRLPSLEGIKREDVIEFLKPKQPLMWDKFSPTSPLRPDVPYVEFDTHDQLRYAFGPAGPDLEYHHLVHQKMVGRFGPRLIHNTHNVVIVTEEQHKCIHAFYNSKLPKTGELFREFVFRLSYESQYRIGLNIARRCGVLR